MAGWFLRGLKSGVRTTHYPGRVEEAPGASVGFPIDTEFDNADQAGDAASRCPTGAITAEGRRVSIDARLCVQCYRCVRGAAYPVLLAAEPAPVFRAMEGESVIPEQESSGGGPFEAVFRRSINILVVDAGDCGACLNEVRQLNAPQYNMHRLGFFITPSPRHADLLLVVGQVTEAMRTPLLAAYRAMPSPKRVAAVGSCAVAGLPVGPSFAAGSGVREVLPVDIEVPGSPPSPLAVLRALLALAGRNIGHNIEALEVRP
jgi:Ni,Fe-hydrogenase III small subunit